MSRRGPLPLPNRLDDLEAVQLRHVDVQEQQVEAPFFRQGQRLPAVARQPHAVALADEQPLQDLRAELVVFGHEDVQRVAAGTGAMADSWAGAGRAAVGTSPLVRLITSVDRVEQLVLLDRLEQVGVDPQLAKRAGSPGRSPEVSRMMRVADSSARSRIMAASARPSVSGMRASSSTSG